MKTSDANHVLLDVLGELWPEEFARIVGKITKKNEDGTAGKLALLWGIWENLGRRVPADYKEKLGKQEDEK